MTANRHHAHDAHADLRRTTNKRFATATPHRRCFANDGHDDGHDVGNYMEITCPPSNPPNERCFEVDGDGTYAEIPCPVHAGTAVPGRQQEESESSLLLEHLNPVRLYNPRNHRRQHQERRQRQQRRRRLADGAALGVGLSALALTILLLVAYCLWRHHDATSTKKEKKERAATDGAYRDVVYRDKLSTGDEDDSGELGRGLDFARPPVAAVADTNNGTRGGSGQGRRRKVHRVSVVDEYDANRTTTTMMRGGASGGGGGVEDVVSVYSDAAGSKSALDAVSPSVVSMHGHRVQHVPLYARPTQRRRWGEACSHPHVDWGGLFYDLFYVAAAYNLGSVYVTAIDNIGVQDERPLFLYVVAAFGGIWMTWYHTVAYDARYAVLDYAHRILHVVRILSISLSILHIKSFDHFSDPKDPTLFSFVLGLLLESTINLLLWVEIFYLGRGGDEMKREAKVNISLFLLPQLILYLSATVIAGVNCFSGNVEKGRLLGPAKDPYPAGPTFVDDRPIWLVFVAYALYQLTSIFWTIYLGTTKKRESYCVPTNIDFMIHRLGEWVMLMLGESVLSLLIVGLSEAKEYFIIVLNGILTVIMLQDLHFESQPSHAEDHALRKTRRGNAYILLIQFYSLALIFLGASYKYMLDLLNYKDDYTNYEDKKDEVKTEEGSSSSQSEPYAGEEPDGYRFRIRVSGGSRFLGGSIVNPDDVNKSREYVVWMYCMSLVVVLLALESMVIAHHGISRERWLSLSDVKRGLQAFLVLVKIALLIFFGVFSTISSFVTLPVSEVTFIGGAIVFVFICTRVVDHEFLQSDQEDHHEQVDAAIHTGGHHHSRDVYTSTVTPSPSDSRD